MRLGVIDCGTNTFHLLVVDVDGNGKFTRVYKERNYVRLGENGLMEIGEIPFQRGIVCLADYKQKLAQLKVQELKVFGTEALRRASNGKAFVEAVKLQTGVQIDLITGDEEARLIHLGVMQAVPPYAGKGLIMDVGGGSVEFIIASSAEVFWARSFPIGVQVLFSEFHKNDPIKKADVGALKAHLESVLQPLFSALQEHDTPLLLGASGSFEIVEELLFDERQHELYSTVPVTDYQKVHGLIVGSSLAERQAMERLPVERVELVVVAFVLIDFIVKKAGIKEVVTSAYAMKEGVLLEMMRADQS